MSYHIIPVHWEHSHCCTCAVYCIVLYCTVQHVQEGGGGGGGAGPPSHHHEPGVGATGGGADIAQEPAPTGAPGAPQLQEQV